MVLCVSSIMYSNAVETFRERYSEFSPSVRSAQRDYQRYRERKQIAHWMAIGFGFVFVCLAALDRNRMSLEAILLANMLSILSGIVLLLLLVALFPTFFRTIFVFCASHDANTLMIGVHPKPQPTEREFSRLVTCLRPIIVDPFNRPLVIVFPRHFVQQFDQCLECAHLESSIRRLPATAGVFASDETTLCGYHLDVSGTLVAKLWPSNGTRLVAYAVGLLPNRWSVSSAAKAPWLVARVVSSVLGARSIARNSQLVHVSNELLFEIFKLL